MVNTVNSNACCPHMLDSILHKPVTQEMRHRMCQFGPWQLAQTNCRLLSPDGNAAVAGFRTTPLRGVLHRSLAKP
jgi:hypothetical protein